MNGPKVVCAGCGSETTVKQPICNRCLGLSEDFPEPVCPLCDEALALDKTGNYHLTQSGGYAGKCLAAGYLGRSTVSGYGCT
jgi:predicted amidophosphoribosyltransferase